MKYLITGAKGFIAGYLINTIKTNEQDAECLCYSHDMPGKTLEKYGKECDFCFHLAGVNRPEDTKEFYSGNVDLTKELIEILKQNKKRPGIVFSSSVHAEKDTDYGKSKKTAEDLIRRYGKDTGASVYIYRLPNVFGAGARPDYNSAVATFCRNAAEGKEIYVDAPDKILDLVYVKDVAEEFLRISKENEQKKEVETGDAGRFYNIESVFSVKLGDVKRKLEGFAKSLEPPFTEYPDVSDRFDKLLYGMFTSYLPGDRLSSAIVTHADERGSFTEAARTQLSGQFSINKTACGITKGNHYHLYKAEKFLVISGKARILLRKTGTKTVYEYNVDGEDQKIVNIPSLYTHSIENTGDRELITLMWITENYKKETADTFYEDVVLKNEGEELTWVRSD